MSPNRTNSLVFKRPKNYWFGIPKYDAKPVWNRLGIVLSNETGSKPVWRRIVEYETGFELVLFGFQMFETIRTFGLVPNV